ncbi:fibrous sheath CABYR-binding protein-like isoform X2 [Photinus pyralis]|nr:fibrous sheath CABYR-binding protein-like isoform X2 [Photinus pyralis]XP_031328552.1 fibrous sheath CABYR-binding protein-like isoform X2 [Photinus pyralis]
MCTPLRDNVRLNLPPDVPNSLRCYDCNVNFTSEHYLLRHLIHHIRQPTVLLSKLSPAPIKITIKSKKNNNFEIINSPTETPSYLFNSEYLAEESQISTGTDNSEQNTEDSGTFSAENLEEHNEMLDEMLESANLDEAVKISFSPNFAADIMDSGSPPVSSEAHDMDLTPTPIITEAEDEQKPPNESPSPTEYPKIRIKTGLLKEPLTITEITDDNPNGEYRPSEIVDISNNNEKTSENTNFWTSCLEDPLKLPDSDRDDSNLLSSFLNNNNDQAKAFGITTDSEFISLDRLDDRNRNALQVYNPSTSSAISNNSSLDSLAGLPMQQLAEQVSRLQPSGSNGGMHQQNVLINIQQFPQVPPPQQTIPYQHPPMYSHPPHPGMPAQPPPLYPPYQYQPSPMYYPPQPNYPPPAPHMQAPPQPPSMQQPPSQQMPQPSHPPHPPQQSMPPPQAPQYRPAMPTRAPPPRQFNPQSQRGPAPRTPMAPRQRAPMIRTRGGMVPTPVRGPRPRMPTTPTQVNGNSQSQPRVIKRTPEQIQSLQAKKKRIDVLVPDKNDDADCQVIAVQPKNTDGGLPQIQSVQGGTSDPTDNVMHLSDSITLSVRNPPPRPQSPKKSDAKVVANILATRGITVTASAKPKEKPAQTKEGAPSVAINLNSAVSIIPTAKNNSNPPSPTKSSSGESRLPTVDLTDDSVPETPRSPIKQNPNSPQKNGRGAALPFRCDLCPAQYPTLGGLSKHRQSYHKTGSPCEIGIPLIDLKQPGILQKLTNLGISNYIPMPSSTPDGHFVVPVVNMNVARNSTVCNLNALGASSLLTIGPVRSLPKPQVNNTSNHHPPPKQ